MDTLPTDIEQSCFKKVHLPLLALWLELVAAAAAAAGAGELGLDLNGLLKSAANPLVLRLLPAGVLVSVASNPPAELKM